MNFDPFKEIGKDWMLVTAGDRFGYNTLTASYGMAGVLWNKNVVMIFIRPQRYTKEFIDANNVFTLSFFDEEYKEALKICGNMSGRDGNKIEAANLTPIVNENVVYFKEAKKVFVCKKLYKDAIQTEHFIDKDIARNFPDHDFHHFYIAEIIKVIEK